jgi:hypothetical protein
MLAPEGEQPVIGRREHVGVGELRGGDMEGVEVPKAERHQFLGPAREILGFGVGPWQRGQPVHDPGRTPGEWILSILEVLGSGVNEGQVFRRCCQELQHRVRSIIDERPGDAHIVTGGRLDAPAGGARRRNTRPHPVTRRGRPIAEAPVPRVCAAPVPVPCSPPLEPAALPDQARIKAAIRRVLEGVPIAV